MLFFDRSTCVVRRTKPIKNIIPVGGRVNPPSIMSKTSPNDAAHEEHTLFNNIFIHTPLSLEGYRRLDNNPEPPFQHTHKHEKTDVALSWTLLSDQTLC